MILAILKSYSAGGEEIPGITFNFNVYFLLTLYFHFHFSLLPKKSRGGGNSIFTICKFKKKVS